MLLHLVRVSPLSSIALLRTSFKIIMNRYGARGSPWRTRVLLLKFVVPPSGVNATAEVFTNIVFMALR